MATSPTRYYASRPSSRAGSRPTSPQSASAVRSQAVAKLKRAASLPRNKDGRRPQQPADSDEPVTRTKDDQHETDDTSQEYEPGPSQPLGDDTPYDDQEVLSPSPVNQTFDHAEMYNAAPGLQRSGSSSSSYHIPTPPQMTFGNLGQAFYGQNTPSSSLTPGQGHTPDWAAMQLAQSYLPSISPIAFPPSPYLTAGNPEGGPGRHTPSPLPTLGALRNLQRSNSAAARAQAMSKLTGGRDTPSSDGSRAPTPLVQNPSSLQRAGTLGASRFLGMPQPPSHEEGPTHKDDEEIMMTPVSPAEPRPRLQRSFTVSSSNMGEERRSAVGRRMVERLAERRAARQKEEEEVRKLWEQRRAATEVSHTASDEEEGGVDRETDRAEEHDDGDDDDLTETIPALHRISPTDLANEPTPTGSSHNVHDQRTAGQTLLQAPDRPASRGTMRSTDEPFQYESHLRRSLSSRTARKVIAAFPDLSELQDLPARQQPHTPEIQQPNRLSTFEEESGNSTSSNANLSSLDPPHAPFATPTRHVHQGSPSTEATLGNSASPGESIMSRDALGSMMFIMGRGSSAGPPLSGTTAESNWPSEVEEQSGSDWGTPGRDLPPFSVNPPPDHSPLAQHQASAPSRLPAKDTTPIASSHASSVTMDTSSSLSPPVGMSARNSMMSWEEVGGPDDRTVPSDAVYHKKSGSMSAKIGRNIRTAMRKRSQSRSSGSSSLTNGNGEPMSPSSLSVAIQNFARRGSESSLSPSSASAVRSMLRTSPQTLTAEHVRHQPSVSSLSPSLPSQTDSAHTSLLQHQLAENPSQVSFLPRADINDPRVHHSKMSPFPGIATFGGRSEDATPDTSPMIIPRSESNLSSNTTRDKSGSQHGHSESILSLPASADVSRRGSDESSGKKSWLAKAFGQTSPRSSGRVSRQASISREILRSESSPAPDRQVVPSADASGSRADSTVGSSSSESDPFAAPPPPPAPVGPSLRPPIFQHRSASPSVSVVHEMSEEGSRLTRFTAGTNRLGTSTPRGDDSEQKLPARQMDEVVQKLEKLERLLAMNSDDPDRPDLLDDPPRKLLLAHQVLQVVNAHTVKDRFLFLFNDLLVIAKPLLTDSVTASLDTDFIVKSVVPLEHIRVSGFDAPRTSLDQSPEYEDFIVHFSQDPFLTVKTLVFKTQGRADTAVLANILFNTADIDRWQLGRYLANDERITRAYLDRCQLGRTRIDDALRMFLLNVHLPQDWDEAETLLRSFANFHFDVNQSTLPYSKELAGDLVLAIMRLHYRHHGMAMFEDEEPSNMHEFLASFRTKDPRGLVPPTLLEEIYQESSRYPILPPLSPEELPEYGRSCSVTPAPSTKMSYNTWSEPITVRLQSPDAAFHVRLRGTGLRFEPEGLNFGNSNEASFRFKGIALGPTAIIFDRLGPNAALYPTLGCGRSISIERAFMRHTFKLEYSTGSHPRKYCFSLAQADTYNRWANHLPKQVAVASQANSKVPVTVKERLRVAAEKTALAVLKEALVPSTSKSPNVSASGWVREDTSGKEAKTQPGRIRRTRSGSISVAYAAQPEDERSLKTINEGMTTSSDRRPVGGETHESDGETIQTGKELVLLCRQNSLLPGIIELLEPGFGGLGGNRYLGVGNGARQTGTSVPGTGSGRSTPVQHHGQSQSLGGFRFGNSTGGSRSNTPVPLAPIGPSGLVRHESERHRALGGLV